MMHPHLLHRSWVPTRFAQPHRRQRSVGVEEIGGAALVEIAGLPLAAKFARQFLWDSVPDEGCVESGGGVSVDAGFGAGGVVVVDETGFDG